MILDILEIHKYQKIKKWEGSLRGGVPNSLRISLRNPKGLCVQIYVFPGVMSPLFLPPTPHFLTSLAVLRLQNHVIDESLFYVLMSTRYWNMNLQPLAPSFSEKMVFGPWSNWDPFCRFFAFFSCPDRAPGQIKKNQEKHKRSSLRF